MKSTELKFPEWVFPRSKQGPGSETEACLWGFDVWVWFVSHPRRTRFPPTSLCQQSSGPERPDSCSLTCFLAQPHIAVGEMRQRRGTSTERTGGWKANTVLAAQTQDTGLRRTNRHEVSLEGPLPSLWGPLGGLLKLNNQPGQLYL